MKEVWVFSYNAIYDCHGTSSYTSVFEDEKDGIAYLKAEVDIIKADHRINKDGLFIDTDHEFRALSTQSDVFELSLKKKEVKKKVTS